jgi:serine protease inhibitor
MRATKYEDGIKRIKAKIEVPMSVDDVSIYILSALTSNIVDLAKIQKLNKRELLQLAKDEVRVKGTKQISIETVENDTKVIVKNYVKQMFPELH